MLKHNSYFDSKVQSVAFERNGRKASVGVILQGEYYFGTEAAERMSVISGELSVRIKGESDFRGYPAGTSFEVPAKSGFDVRAAAASAYLCEYL